MRHKGYDWDGAIDYYDRSIEVAIRLGRESEVLKKHDGKIEYLYVAKQGRKCKDAP